MHKVKPNTRPSDLFLKAEINGEYMYQCIICGKTYYTRTGVKQHVVRKHFKKQENTTTH